MNSHRSHTVKGPAISVIVIYQRWNLYKTTVHKCIKGIKHAYSLFKQTVIHHKNTIHLKNSNFTDMVWFLHASVLPTMSSMLRLANNLNNFTVASIYIHSWIYTYTFMNEIGRLLFFFKESAIFSSCCESCGGISYCDFVSSRFRSG